MPHVRIFVSRSLVSLRANQVSVFLSSFRLTAGMSHIYQVTLS